MLKYFATVLGSTNNLLALERAELRRALDAFHAEIGGKLIYVHALPGLPVDGILRSAFEYKGIYIRKHFNHLNNDEETDDFCELLLGEGLATIHFSLNAHVDDYFYLEHPFVVLIPANSDLLLQTTSMSFSEVIILGDYKLPSDAVVMVRESNKNQVPDYYHKNHKVVVFNDVVSSPSEYYHDLNKKGQL